MLEWRPVQDAVRFLRAHAAVKADLVGIAVDRRRGTAWIGDDQPMPVLAMLVPVAQPRLFPAPMHIVVIVFAELAGHLHRRIVLADMPGPIGQDTVILEHGFGLAPQVAVEEQAVVPAVSQVAQPRPDHRFVAGTGAVAAELPERKDMAVEITLAAVAAQQAERDLPADEIPGRQCGMIGKDFDRELKIARQRFRAVDAIRQQKRIRRLAFEFESQQTIVLEIERQSCQVVLGIRHNDNGLSLEPALR